MNNYLEIIYTFDQGQSIRRINYFDIPKTALLSEIAFLTFLKAIYEHDLGKKVILGLDVLKELQSSSLVVNYDQDIRKISTCLYCKNPDAKLYWPKFIKANRGKWCFENGLDWSEFENESNYLDLSEIQLKHFTKAVARQLQAIEKHQQNIN